MDADVIIVGAGAAGLMAARTLGEAGKKVLVLEARDRIGGRIYPLPASDFGYEAMGGAEFVHGEARLTRALVEEAGLHLTHGIEWWSVLDGTPRVNEHITPNNPELIEKLNALKGDMTLVEFFDAHFPDEAHTPLREYIFRRVMAYDAADPARASALSLRDELLSTSGSKQFALVEGYGALLRYLESKIHEHDAQILLGKAVVRVDYSSGAVTIECADGSRYQAQQVLVTVPLPVIKDISYVPPVPKKLAAAEAMGFGSTIKILLNFTTKWWASPEREANFEKMFFMFSREAIPTWWTQHPAPHLTLTGWLAGPSALAIQEMGDDELVTLALTSLSNIFKITTEELRSYLSASKVAAWGRDPYAQGSYSYLTPASEAAMEELAKPEANRLYFAGEALYDGDENGTVEAALASGKAAAEKVIAAA